MTKALQILGAVAMFGAIVAETMHQTGQLGGGEGLGRLAGVAGLLVYLAGRGLAGLRPTRRQT